MIKNSKQHIEAADLLELYKNTKPKELLVCSYTLSLGYLEQKLFTRFKKDHDTKITAVTSTASVTESFFEASSLNGVGTEYYVYQINDYPYAFHPKIFAAIDKNNDFVVYVGGANFTYPGMCLNLDAVEKIDHDEISELTKKNLVTFFDELENQIKSRDFTKNISRFRSCLENITVNNSSSISFVHNFEESIAKQIVKDTGDIIKIRIISPYYDKNMRALKSFIKLLDNPEVEILCNKNDDKVNLKEIPTKFKIYNSERPKSQINRFMHAKVYLLYSNEFVHVCTGSANCTWPGLMSTKDEGNWESCVIRKNISKDYAESFWKEFYPKLLKKKNYWKFILKKKDVNGKDKVLHFNAVINYDMITITPVSNFPNISFDASVNILTRDGEEIRIDLKDLDVKSEITFNLEPDVIELIGDDPVRVELQITKPALKHGRAWVMQKHKLRKSVKIRKLEQAISQLQYNNPEGWDQTLEIIEFISTNLNYISIKRPTGRKTIKTKKRELGSFSVPTISGVYSVDDVVPSSEWGISLYDIIDFGSSIRKLIEKGFSIFGDDDDEPVEDDDGKETPVDPEKMKKHKEQPGKTLWADDDLEQRKQDVIDQIPNISSIYENSVIQPFNNYLNNKENISKSESSVRFEALLDLTNFCLKFIRFIRLELSSQSIYSDSNKNIKKYLNEVLTILNWFWRQYPKIKENFNLSKKYLKEVFRSSELLPEMMNCLIEIWHLNYEERLSKKKNFFDAIEEFFDLFDLETIQSTLRVFLEGSDRFNNERNNLLYDSKKNREILSNIKRYQDRLNSAGKLYMKHIKYLYWEDAYYYHTEALYHYQKRPYSPRQYYDEHKKRLKIALFMMEKCKNEGQKDLGDKFDPQIYESKNVVGISELINELQHVLCPSCRCKFNIDIFEELKQFQLKKCSDCFLLIVPVDKHIPYKFKNAKDVEWQMNIEDQS